MENNKTIKIDDELWKQVKRIAIDKDIAVQEIVKQALEKYLEEK